MMKKRTVKKGTSPRGWTESEYEQEFRFLSIEIMDAIVISETYDEIIRLALEDNAILPAVNKDALFWRTQVYSLQTSLFIMLGRIFDPATDAHSIHNLIAATLGNIKFFSKDALSARKINGKPKPDWLDNFMSRAWVPNKVSDLRHLKKVFKPQAAKFKHVYLPIRNGIFAHRLVIDRKQVSELFAGIDRKEIEQILDFLHDLIDAIEQLFVNGQKPQLGRRSYGTFNQAIRDGVKSVLAKVGASAPE
jgi:hypothetical protein